MLVELIRYKSKLPYDFYKEIILNYRRILPTLDIQEIRDLAFAAPKSNKVFEILLAAYAVPPRIYLRAYTKGNTAINHVITIMISIIDNISILVYNRNRKR